MPNRNLRLVEKHPRPNLYVVPRREPERLDLGDVIGVVIGVCVSALAMGALYALIVVVTP